MKLKIKVTKKIIAESMFCNALNKKIGENCAVALAIRDIFPNAWVCPNAILLRKNTACSTDIIIYLPKSAAEFIATFDNLKPNPFERLKLPEFEFEIEIKDEWLEKLVNIDEVKELLKSHPNLELVSQ
jgi:hypothetical protein